MGLGEAIGMAAPLYNLAFIILVILLFIRLFSYPQQKFAYFKPWKLLTFAIGVAVLETIMTILRGFGTISFHPAVFGIFEMVILVTFIYMILLQKQFVKTGKKE